MIFNSSNYEDINRYYRNTYVKFRDFGDRLFWIDSVNRNVVSGEDENNQLFELYLNDEYPYEVDYVIPRKSFFQYKNKACLLHRIPARQYQRGISANNTQIVALSRQGSAGQLDINFEVLREYVSKPKFPAFDKGITSKGKFISVALSPRFAYVPEIKAIFVDTKSIGYVDHAAHKVVLTHKIFVPELKALAKDSIFEVVHG